MSYNPSIVNNNIFFAKISNPIEIAITAAVSATSDRMHVISGTSADYTITLPVSPATGTVVSFRVKEYTLANKQYKLDAGVGVIVCGRTRYFVLIHTNSATLIWNGTAWAALELNLESPWIVGTNTINGVTTNPTKGAGAQDQLYWKRTGSSMELLSFYEHTAVAGTAGSGRYLWPIPLGASIDTTVTPTGTFANSGQIPSVVGSAFGNQTYFGVGSVVVYDSTNLALICESSGFAVIFSPDMVGSGFCPLSSANIALNWSARVPITDW